MILRPALAALLYLAAVVLPNYLIAHFGIVDVAPGPWVLMAPAAVYAVGVALVARDILDDTLNDGTSNGRWFSMLAILCLIGVGTCLSLLLGDGRVALASGAAFLLSEVLDLTIYRGVRREHGSWSLAALLSSYAGALVDSLVFLSIAFGSLAFLPGQWVGKAVAVTLFVLVAAVARPLWRTEPLAC